MVGQEGKIRWPEVPSPVRGGTADGCCQLFSGKSLYYFKLQSLKLRWCRCPGMKESARSEMEQKTRGD